MTNPTPLPDPTRLANHLGMILDSVRKAAAARASKDWSIVPAVVLLWSYLNRLERRFKALAARLLAGPLPAPRVRQQPAERPRTSPKPRAPQNFGWLLRQRIQDATCFRSQLHYLLRDPEMAALIQQVPQAGRLLRPFCLLLGIGPEHDLPPALFPPKVARKTVLQKTAVSVTPHAPPAAERPSDSNAPITAFPLPA